MSNYAYYNGVFDKKERISVPLSDRSIFFGDAIYDAAVGSGKRIFQLEEHVCRLLSNAAKMGFKNIPDYDTLTSVLAELASRAALPFFFLYFQLSRDLDLRQHSARGASKSNLLATIDEAPFPDPDRRLRLILLADERYGYCDVKTVNLLPNVMYSTEADVRGADEAVLHRGGIVTECAHSSVFIIKNGTLITHPLDHTVLPGITRSTVLSLCKDAGIPCLERAFSTEEMFFADEVLVTSTGKLCVGVDSIDGVTVGGKCPALSSKIRNLTYEYFVKSLS